MNASEARHANLGYFNREAAENSPGKTALIDLSGAAAREINHGALDDRMERVAGALGGLGLKAGDRLLLGMGNRIEFIEAFFGAMRAGIVPLPLNTKFGADTIEFVLGDSGCTAAIVEPACNPHLAAIVEAAGLTPRISVEPLPGWATYENLLAAAPASMAPPPITPGQVAFTPYTSGSTGRPKGVLLTHEGLLWAIRSTQRFLPSAPDDRTLVATPLFHKNAMRVSIKPVLYAGASAVILPAFEPRTFLDALATYGCTHTGGVPAMYRMLLEQKDLLETLSFPKLKSLSMGSAVVGKDLLDGVERAFGIAAIESYGLTEAGGPLRSPIDGRAPPIGSCGVVAPEWEVKLVDGEGRENGEIGELWVRAPSVMQGYLNRPELTAERLVDGWLKTGDILRRDSEGFFYFQSRTDDMFSCGGENVYPKEVELMLVRHPAVLDAAAFPVPHEVKGLAPSALVVLRPDAEASAEDLKRHCLENGPAYAHPRHVFFVDSLPASSTGKLDRNAVREEGLARLARSGDGAA
jgi:acyl-CoA synthetase (AMP-forming)/AMP-acid ligase II